MRHLIEPPVFDIFKDELLMPFKYIKCYQHNLKINYAVGAVANGIKTDAFTFFLLFFYSRVIGLDPLLASLAIATSLIIDSVTDPFMGAISDRTNSKYGRRHPYMFVSFLPVSIFYVLLFSPPTIWGSIHNHNFFGGCLSVHL